MRMRSLFMVALIATGCTSLQPGRVPDRFTGQQFEVAKGITFLAGDYSVFFQKGQIVRSGLSVWDTHCKLRLKESHKDSWTVSEGQYRISGFNRYDANCSRYDCVDVQEFVLQAVKGPEAEKLSCRQQYNIGDGSPGPEPINAEQLRITLGGYLRLKPAE